MTRLHSELLAHSLLFHMTATCNSKRTCYSWLMYVNLVKAEMYRVCSQPTVFLFHFLYKKHFVLGLLCCLLCIAILLLAANILYNVGMEVFLASIYEQYLHTCIYVHIICACTYTIYIHIYTYIRPLHIH